MIELSVADLLEADPYRKDNKSIFPEPMHSWLFEHKDKIVIYVTFYANKESIPFEKLTVWLAFHYTYIQLEFNDINDELYFKIAFA